MRKILREVQGDYALGVALTIQRGLVEPEWTKLGELEGRDDVINAIAVAIQDRSWPNVSK